MFWGTTSLLKFPTFTLPNPPHREALVRWNNEVVLFKKKKKKEEVAFFRYGSSKCARDNGGGAERGGMPFLQAAGPQSPSPAEGCSARLLRQAEPAAYRKGGCLVSRGHLFF